MAVSPNENGGWLHLQKAERGLLALEKVTLFYIGVTTLALLVFFNEMHEPLRLLLGRGMVALGIGIAVGLYRLVPTRFTLVLRAIYPLALLGYWYPDTYEFCQLFPNRDYLFAGFDQSLFGCQPSLEMARWLPGIVWSELFNMGYFSYYLFILVGAVAPLIWRREDFLRTAFVIMAGFFCFYFIYLFLPVAGPQYYFHAVPAELVAKGHFPELGDYFRYHTEMRPNGELGGFFKGLVEATQASGERPTAAFPSSHVGMSTILMLLMYRTKRLLAYIALPFYIFLCGATVFIEAHYLVDVFGGWVAALFFYWLTNRLYELRCLNDERFINPSSRYA